MAWFSWLHYYDPDCHPVATLSSNTLHAMERCVTFTAAACCHRLPAATLPAESLVRMASRGESLQRWRATTHLIVDEVRQAAGAEACRQNCNRPNVAAPASRLLYCNMH